MNQSVKLNQKSKFLLFRVTYYTIKTDIISYYLRPTSTVDKLGNDNNKKYEYVAAPK